MTVRPATRRPPLKSATAQKFSARVRCARRSQVAGGHAVVNIQPEERSGRQTIWRLLGQETAERLAAYSVHCLHHAHAQALHRYRLATWTNNTTYGVDRYHCLCSTLGSVAEARLKPVKVHR